MHTPRLAPVRRGAVPRRRAARSLSTTRRLERRAASSQPTRRVTARARRDAPSRTACSRQRRSPASSHAHGFRDPRACIGSSCCRSRCTRRSGRARFTQAVERVLDAIGPAAAVRFAGHDRRRTVRVLVTGATGFTGGHLARALAARGRQRSRAGARPRRSAGELDAAGVELVVGRSARRARARDAAVAASTSSITSRRIYRQAGLSDDDVSRGQRDGGADSSSKRRRAPASARVVHCSTVGVHGDIEHPPANEDAPLRPGDIYQETKLEGERLAREAGRAHAASRSRSRGRPASTVRAIAGC